MGSPEQNICHACMAVAVVISLRSTVLSLVKMNEIYFLLLLHKQSHLYSSQIFPFVCHQTFLVKIYQRVFSCSHLFIDQSSIFLGEK